MIADVHTYTFLQTADCLYLLFIDACIYQLQIAVSTLTDAYIYTCRYGGTVYFFAAHGSLNAISRSSFKGAELPEYFVRTMTVTFPAGSACGTRAMIWPAC